MAVRLSVTSKLVGAEWLSVSVSFRGFRGQSSSTMARASQRPSRKTNTLEQKEAKIAKKSKTGDDFRQRLAAGEHYGLSEPARRAKQLAPSGAPHCSERETPARGQKS
jgi:hypothetical protein